MEVRDPALEWLLRDGDPAVRALVRRDLLHERVDEDEADRSPVVRALLGGLLPARDLRSSPYRKWTGAHWRLVSLVELGIRSGHPGAVAAADVVLDHWAGRRRLRSVPVVDGLPRRCASQEGNALAVACRLGLADDDRARTLAHRLADWQWPDGGWNCDRRPEARRSSFHETLPALWGLHEHAAATGDSTSAAAAARAAELLLAHRVVLSLRTGRPLSAAVVQLHYPPYWYYDALQALLVLTRAGFGADPRTEVARDLVASRRGESGRWSADRRWWKRPGSAGSGVEAVDWREQGDVESQLLTLNALRVLAPRAGTSSP